MKHFALAAMLGLAVIAPVQAQTVVKHLHITSIPAEVELMNSIADEFMAANPDIKVELPFLENEAFKAKLTTLLQSADAPDVFHSWGGGVFYEQAAAGVLRPIQDVLSAEAKDNVGTAGISAFTAPDGNLYGVARDVSEVVLWYNKALFDQAGVDPASMSTWEGFLAGVQAFKDAGITPIAIGAKDKWPAHFWWSKLVVRLAGKDGFDADLTECSDELSYDIPAFHVEWVPHDMPEAVPIGWGEKLPPRVGRGVAFASPFGSHVCAIVEAEVSPRGVIRIRRGVAAVDCGPVMNPNTVEAQIQGGLIFGWTMALYNEITFEKGAVKQSNFHDYRMMRLNETPPIEVHIVKNEGPIGGMGEVGTAIAAPALANAVFAATGVRLRRLPLDPRLLADPKAGAA